MDGGHTYVPFARDESYRYEVGKDDVESSAVFIGKVQMSDFGMCRI